MWESKERTGSGPDEEQNLGDRLEKAIAASADNGELLEQCEVLAAQIEERLGWREQAEA